MRIIEKKCQHHWSVGESHSWNDCKSTASRRLKSWTDVMSTWWCDSGGKNVLTCRENYVTQNIVITVKLMFDLARSLISVSNTGTHEFIKDASLFVIKSHWFGSCSFPSLVRKKFPVSAVSASVTIISIIVAVTFWRSNECSRQSLCMISLSLWYWRVVTRNMTADLLHADVWKDIMRLE